MMSLVRSLCSAPITSCDLYEQTGENSRMGGLCGADRQQSRYMLRIQVVAYVQEHVNAT